MKRVHAIVVLMMGAALGIGYMLLGDKGASNTDPYAKGPTADNQWVADPPHHGSEEWRALGNVEGHAVCLRHGAGVAHQGGDDVVQGAIGSHRQAGDHHKPARQALA